MCRRFTTAVVALWGGAREGWRPCRWMSHRHPAPCPLPARGSGARVTATRNLPACLLQPCVRRAAGVVERLYGTPRDQPRAQGGSRAARPAERTLDAIEHGGTAHAGQGPSPAGRPVEELDRLRDRTQGGGKTRRPAGSPARLPALRGEGRARGWRRDAGVERAPTSSTARSLPACWSWRRVSPGSPRALSPETPRSASRRSAAPPSAACSARTSAAES